MSAKLEKLGTDLKRAREKAEEWSNKAEELERKYREQEDTEICEITRSFRLTPEQLIRLLRETGNGLPDPLLAAEIEREGEVEENEY